MLGQYAMDAESSIIEPFIDYIGDKLPNQLLEKYTNGEITAAQVGALVLMLEKDENGVYHARDDCWQQFAGYMDLYDIAFDLGTDMKNKKYEYSLNGRDYVIWAWKGDYVNLGSGAELGIYSQDSQSGFDMLGRGFWFVDKSLALPMTMVLKDNEGNIIADYDPGNDGDEDTPREQWWITSFNPEYKDIKAEDLNVTFEIDFTDNPEMYDAFVQSDDYIKGEKFGELKTIDGTHKIQCAF